MQERIVLILAALAAAAAVAGCGGSGGSEKTRIVAAFYPLAYLAERVAPDADVTNLTPPGAEPHDLELSARDVESLRDADLVLYLGGGFQPALEDAVAGHEHAVDLLAGQELLEGSGHEEEGHDEDEPEADPHVWLDPVRFADLARAVAEAVRDPGAADAVVADLGELDRELRAGLAECERRELVTSHAAFAYLARAYGLEQLALTGLSPEAEPTPRDLERLVGEVRERGATTVFFETLVSPRLAETVAREAGAATAVLDPLEGLTDDAASRGADYLSVMRDNLAALRKGLGCA